MTTWTLICKSGIQLEFEYIEPDKELGYPESMEILTNVKWLSDKQVAFLCKQDLADYNTYIADMKLERRILERYDD